MNVRTKPLEKIEQRKEDFPILFSFSQLDQLLLKIHSRKFLFILIQISIVLGWECRLPIKGQVDGYKYAETLNWFEI